MRTFRKFSYREADYRIYPPDTKEITDTIIRERDALEEFTSGNREFLESLTPLSSLPPGAPLSAKLMSAAAASAGVGPMAAVAGRIAQAAAEAAEAEAEAEVIVENGGDIFMILKKELVLGIFTDVPELKNRIAFRIKPKDTPLAVCSSSGTMGHSLSLGRCNLATVFAGSGALADAAATRACNMVKEEEDIENALNTIMAIKGIRGIMIIKNGKVGLAGNVPEIIPGSDPEMTAKVTKHPASDFPAE